MILKVFEDEKAMKPKAIFGGNFSFEIHGKILIVYTGRDTHTFKCEGFDTTANDRMCFAWEHLRKYSGRKNES